MRLETIPPKWDLIVVGGGITGAGVFREAARMGLGVLLVEQKDFAWGTSSRSSKLIHGGLRYLKEGRLLLTRESVQERERLLKEAPGLVEPLAFLVPVYRDRGPGKWTLEAGLSIYDLIAGKRRHLFLSPAELFKLAPHIDQKLLSGGFQFYDAQVDDARLVLRLINEGIRFGGQALNYARAVEILRDSDKAVTGLRVADSEAPLTRNLTTGAIVNATGAWAKTLHPLPEANLHMRPLRGTHLIYPHHSLPIEQAISFMHPEDNRAVFIIPWEGVVLVGTTDLDHTADLGLDPVATQEEVLYLVKGLARLFPALDFSLKNCISTFAGVRPVLSRGGRDPSQESREHLIWKDKGLATITGGKLTIFRIMARDALKAIRPFLPACQIPSESDPIFLPVPETPAQGSGLSRGKWRHLYGRYGEQAEDMVRNAKPADLSAVPGTQTLWAEIPFAARNERIRHLDDLLLRRVRIGLMIPQGGKIHLGRIRELCRPYLRWNNRKWRREVNRYLNRWQYAHGLPADLRPAPPLRVLASVSQLRSSIADYTRRIFSISRP
jgi:glycerol-3-phosphate dehydrogenase